jgi:hypothetical protein
MFVLVLIDWLITKHRLLSIILFQQLYQTLPSFINLHSNILFRFLIEKQRLSSARILQRQITLLYHSFNGFDIRAGRESLALVDRRNTFAGRGLVGGLLKNLFKGFVIRGVVLLKLGFSFHLLEFILDYSLV